MNNGTSTGKTGRDIGVFIAIAASMLLVMLLDLYVLPQHFLVSALYAVPMLIAARRWPPRPVGIVTALVIALDLLSVFVKHVPVSVWPYGVFALLSLGYLAVQLSTQMEETAKRAQEANEAQVRLQEFLGMVAHDLRRPLTTVLGYAQVLGRSRKSERPETEQKALLSIEDAAAHMRRLIDDLLDAAQVGSGHFEVRPVRMDLVAVTRQIVEQQQATTDKHRLILEVPEQLEGQWDRERIIQLLTNLISNAIKYSPQGGEVRVFVDRSPGEALLGVSDHGIGIGLEDVVLLFQPFSRLYREQPVKGTGLGLYISEAIVKAHGGRIWVESKPGKGSTFYVALPYDAE